MTACMAQGCRATARWAVKLCVPAAIGPGIAHAIRPATALTSLVFCDRHIMAAKPAGILNDRIIAAMVAADKGKPYRLDFDRAYIARVSTASPEYLIVHGKAARA